MKNFRKITDIQFPQFSGININMMPFIMGDYSSVPMEYRNYYSIIDSCNIDESELGKTGYLSISETFVEKGFSQRRGGLHVEKHPSNSWGGGAWGGKGGLYMASSVDDSCMVWDACIDIPGPMGNCEHLRNTLGEGICMKAGELFWMHDATPHESLPVNNNTNRQFIRVITSQVSIWYSKHNTANRLGVLPACPIVEYSKFN